MLNPWKIYVDFFLLAKFSFDVCGLEDKKWIFKNLICVFFLFTALFSVEGFKDISFEVCIWGNVILTRFSDNFFNRQFFIGAYVCTLVWEFHYLSFISSFLLCVSVWCFNGNIIHGFHFLLNSILISFYIRLAFHFICFIYWLFTCFIQ